jgi:type I restriction enzyme, S subunit
MSSTRMQLPPSWRLATLGEITARAVDQSGPTGREFTYVDISSVDNETKRIADPRTLAAAGAPSRARQRLQSDDVLVSMTRPNLNAVARVPRELDGAVGSTGFHVLRSTGVDPRWIAYAVQTHNFVEAMSSLVQGALYPAVRPNDIRSFPIPIPPIAEQRRIVAALEEHLSDLDAAFVSLERARANIVRCSSAAREAAFRGFPNVALGELLAAPLTNGRSVPTSEIGFPVLRLTALSAGKVLLSERKVGAWSEAEARPHVVREGDFLIARGNGSLNLVGRGGIVGPVNDDVAYPDTLIRARVNTDRVLHDYLRHAWDSLSVRRQIESYARTTAGIYKINQGHIESVLIPLPPSLTEQRAIAAHLELQLDGLARVDSEIDTQLARGRQLRQAILKRAFEGKLVPQNPADEPASGLLARLKDVPVSDNRSARPSPTKRVRSTSRRRRT